MGGSNDDVGEWYDGLDFYHRKISGGRAHHGLWATGAETFGEALLALEAVVADFVKPAAGLEICDLGCGYAEMTAAWARETGARITAVTNSHVQAAAVTAARGRAKGARGNFTIIAADWMAWHPPVRFDGIAAVESLEHFSDPAGAIRKISVCLTADGFAVIAAWTLATRKPGWRKRWLTGPILAAGKLHGMGTRAELREEFAACGLRETRFSDLTKQVRGTWSAFAVETLKAAVSDTGFRRWLCGRRLGKNIRLGFSVLRVIAAYRLGLLEYGIFRFERAKTPSENSA